MTIRAIIQNRWAKVVFGFVFWTLMGLSFACQFHISTSQAGLDVSWQQAITSSLADWYVFAVLSIPVTALARHFHFEAGTRVSSILVHLFGSALFSLGYIVLRAWVSTWQSTSTLPFVDAYKTLLVKTWHFNFLFYWVIIAISFAFDYYRKYRDHEVRAAELESRLTKARLQALQMQLNPHFLFNALHSVSALMHKDIDAADRMVARLSELLRAALETTDSQEVTLKRELDLLQRYLEIEQIRFGSRLAVKIDAQPDTLEAQVPSLIMQPLVENAIRHGIEPHSRPGRIELRAQRKSDELTLEVQDNGEGLSGNGPAREGVGLSNTRARLKTLYGDAHEFELRSTPNGGLLVRLMIPFRTKTQHP